MSELKVNLKLYPEWVKDDIRTQLADTMEDYNRMRAQLAAAQAEIERLRAVIRRVEWSVVEIGPTWGEGRRRCPICQNMQIEDHEPDCPFYQWEGGAQ